MRRELPPLIGFLLCILAANWAVVEYGLVPVGFGLLATAGTYFAGLTFVLRDALQDAGGRTIVLLAIIVGAALSFILAAAIVEPGDLPPGVTPFRIALASGLAFLLAELADYAVYTPLRDGGYVRAALASNAVGALVDTLLFLWISGFGLAQGLILGQMVGKLWVTIGVVGCVLLLRLARSRRLDAVLR